MCITSNNNNINQFQTAHVLYIYICLQNKIYVAIELREN